MLIKAKALKGYSLDGLDGDIGFAAEFLVDDTHWAVRYLVADTGGWLTGKKVLISPYSLSGIDTAARKASIQLTKKQIESSPSIDTDAPVSEQFETSFNGYYGYPAYWGGPFMWGAYPTVVRDRTQWSLPTAEEMNWNRHLRSTSEVTGYHLRAVDGEIGHVDDFILDDETWSIRYLVPATKNWWPGKKVLVSPKWIDSVSWGNRELAVGLSREAIKAAPEFNDASPLTRVYEDELYAHYSRERYWSDRRAAA